MKNILIAPSSFGDCGQEPLDMLEKAGFSYQLNPYKRKLTSQELLDLAKDCPGVIAGVEEYTAQVLAELPALKCISRCGVGMDSIDLPRARELGIAVRNTPDGPTDPVSELALGLILNLLRKIGKADRDIKEGRWAKAHGALLKGKTVGIVGMGRIGRKTARLLGAFEANVIYHDPAVESVEGAKKAGSLRALLETTDIVVLHLSWKKSAGYLLAGPELDAMKPGAYLVNLARGGVVDENALYERLKEGNLAGAALDVFEEEPYKGPLRELENVLLTPHIGSYAKEAKLRMEADAVRNLIETLEGLK